MSLEIYEKLCKWRRLTPTERTRVLLNLLLVSEQERVVILLDEEIKKEIKYEIVPLFEGSDRILVLVSLFDVRWSLKSPDEAEVAIRDLEIICRSSSVEILEKLLPRFEGIENLLTPGEQRKLVLACVSSYNEKEKIHVLFKKFQTIYTIEELFSTLTCTELSRYLDKMTLKAKMKFIKSTSNQECLRQILRSITEDKLPEVIDKCFYELCYIFQKQIEDLLLDLCKRDVSTSNSKLRDL